MQHPLINLVNTTLSQRRPIMKSGSVLKCPFYTPVVPTSTSADPVCSMPVWTWNCYKLKTSWKSGCVINKTIEKSLVSELVTKILTDTQTLKWLQKKFTSYYSYSGSLHNITFGFGKFGFIKVFAYMDFFTYAILFWYLVFLTFVLCKELIYIFWPP